MDLKTSKGLFNPKEIVFLLLLKIKGYFAKASNKELNPPFLTYYRYRVLSKSITSPFYHMMLIYAYFFLG
jgi:hypothetical protein